MKKTDYRRNWDRAWASYTGPVRVTIDGITHTGGYDGEWLLLNGDGDEVCHDILCSQCDPPASTYPPDSDFVWMTVCLDNGNEIFVQPKNVEPITEQGGSHE